MSLCGKMGIIILDTKDKTLADESAAFVHGWEGVLKTKIKTKGYRP